MHIDIYDTSSKVNYILLQAFPISNARRLHAGPHSWLSRADLEIPQISHLACSWLTGGRNHHLHSPKPAGFPIPITSSESNDTYIYIYIYIYIQTRRNIAIHIYSVNTIQITINLKLKTQNAACVMGNALFSFDWTKKRPIDPISDFMTGNVHVPSPTKLKATVKTEDRVHTHT